MAISRDQWLPQSLQTGSHPRVDVIMTRSPIPRLDVERIVDLVPGTAHFAIANHSQLNYRTGVITA